MRLEGDAFKAWADRVYQQGPMASWTAISKEVGITRGTLMMQKAKNAVDPRAVLAFARANDCDPVRELSSFRGFALLRQRFAAPDDSELLTQIAVADLFDEISARTEERQGPRQPLAPWGAPPYALAMWFAHSGGMDYNRRVREVLGISDTATAKKIHQGQFGVDQIVPVCEAMGMNPLLGLLILGYITEEEAALGGGLRESALARARADALSDQLQQSVRYIRRRLQLADRVDEAITMLS
ncbi:hypothetical protein JRG18_12230 [Kocuria palustris]|jgi:hypothetical protein|uniref:hypothetical protein n=1 Tax=Kocuria palustris TaxID=71999 RepID=UPI0019CF9DC0|nr:hypothetical protein [Kocuria palustris]MBN6754276.1 hypothetical protein [Kocuria palustris]MBN6759221.1 hypothetical protein [Kocuria palustris]MBN6764261.1 hypothetical protein [Kocuria palustris]MBN6783746.1 hypothetical protein [Kocuria palustris]MBN6800228.1 hypothetical protein [Kocuria palustris]